MTAGLKPDRAFSGQNLRWSAPSESKETFVPSQWFPTIPQEKFQRRVLVVVKFPPTEDGNLSGHLSRST